MSETNLGIDSFSYPISIPLAGIDTEFRNEYFSIPHRDTNFRGIDTCFDTKVSMYQYLTSYPADTTKRLGCHNMIAVSFALKVCVRAS